MKRLISLILVIAMLLSLAPAVFADETTSSGVALVFGEPEEREATLYNADSSAEPQTAKYYAIPVKVRNNTNEELMLSLFECDINYDTLGLAPVSYQTSADAGISVVSYSGVLSSSNWLKVHSANNGVVVVTGGLQSGEFTDNSLLKISANSEAALFTLNLRNADSAENGTYQLKYANTFFDGQENRENVVGSDYTTSSGVTYKAAYSETEGLDISSTATITVTDGAAPTLASVSIEPSNKNAVYGTPETFKLKALSTKGADITGLVNWAATGLEYSADCLTVSTTKETNAGVYTITASAIENQSQGESKECELTVDKAKLDSVSLTLNGYQKGQLVSAATVTGDHCTVPNNGCMWEVRGDHPSENDKFQAATSYKLTAKFTINSNYALDTSGNVILHVGNETVTSTYTFDGEYYSAEFQLPETGNKDTVTITTLPTASEATYGDTLSDVTLTGGSASVDGKFAWTNGDQSVGNAGNNSFEVTFTPSDETTYDSATANVTVKVDPKSIQANDVTIDEIPSQSYTGQEIQPTLTIKFKDEPLVLNTDFNLDYDKNVDCGTATVKIIGIGNFSGETTKTFQITKSLSACTIEPITGTFVYSGTAFEPTVTVKDGDKPLTQDTDYTVSYSGNTKAGTATVTVTGQGNYTGSVEKNFTIKPQHIGIDTSKNTISETFTYDGKAKEPKVPTLIAGINTEVTLTKDKDYTVEYSNNVNAGSEAKITFKPKDGSNYTFGQFTLNFTIGKADLTIDTNPRTMNIRYGVTTAQTFSEWGLPADVAFNAKIGDDDVADEKKILNGAILNGTTLSIHLNTTTVDNVGNTATIPVTFSSTNYNDFTITLKVTIVDKLSAELMVTSLTDGMSMIYGDEKTVTWSVAEEAKGGEIVFRSSAENVIKAEGNKITAVGVGTATITVTYDSADYYDQKTFTITVNKKPIIVTADNMTIAYGDNPLGFSYTVPEDTLVGKDILHITAETTATKESPVGTYDITLSQTEGANSNYAITPEKGTLTITKAPLTIESATVEGKTYDGTTAATVTGVTFSGLKNNEELTSGTDYTVSGEFKDANAGVDKEVTVTVTLQDTAKAKNYELKSGTITTTAKIEKRTTQVKITAIQNAVYTGKPYARENYTVNSENAVFKFFKADGEHLGDQINTPTDVGKYFIEAIVEETANEKLSAHTASFEITAKPLTDSDITVDAIPDQTYTGLQITPAVTVKYNGMTLTKGTDYTVVSSGNCADAGQATVHINGEGNYSGTIEKTFTIVPKLVEGVTVTVADTDLVYDKTEKKPNVTVGSGATGIPADNYTVAYSNNTNAGTATATVTFTGNYSGTATGTFTIAPMTIESLTWTSDTFYYDKTEKTVTATATGLIEGDEATVTVTGGKQTAIGSYIATATAISNPNYKLADGLTHPFTIKNAIESISVVAIVSGQAGESKTITATVDGLTIKLTGTMKENESLELTINGAKYYVANNADTVMVTVGDNEYIKYKLDKSDLKETPANVKLTEDTPVIEPKQGATQVTMDAADTIGKSSETRSEGLAAATAEAVTNEAASKATGSETIKAETKLEIQVESYVPNDDNGKSVLTLEITPTVTYTYKDESGEQKTETKTISNSDIKAPVTISVKLPEGMPTTNLFVKHGDEYIKPEVDKQNGVITWQQSSFSPSVIMSDARYAEIRFVMNDEKTVTTVVIDASWQNKKLPVDESRSNFKGWQFAGVEGTFDTVTSELLTKLDELRQQYDAALIATSVSGSSSEPDDKPSKPGSSSSGPLLPSTGADELAFRDVSKYDYYYNAVKWAVNKGVTSGTGRYTFSPDDACTRAQTVTFLWRAAGCPKASTKTNPFTDVHVNDYFYEAVLWAVENGITNGTSKTTFSPNASVTRAQVATFLWRANGEPAARDSGFADVAANAYYAKAVAWAYAEGITTGTGFGVFSPDSICTRAQIVTFLFRNAK